MQYHSCSITVSLTVLDLSDHDVTKQGELCEFSTNFETIQRVCLSISIEVTVVDIIQIYYSHYNKENLENLHNVTNSRKCATT